MYFDDFKTGDTFELKSVKIDRQKMIDFAMDYDPQKIHMDEDHGKTSRYGDIIAPVFSGEELTGKVTIQNVIPRNPYNGIVEVGIAIYDEEGKMVMDTLTEAILHRRREK